VSNNFFNGGIMATNGTKRVGVTSKYLRAKFGHGIDEGFTSVPNLLLDHAHKIGITDKALYFIIQILRAQDRKRRLIKDRDLNMMSSAKTLERIRKELTGFVDPDGYNLIFVKTYYEREEKTGRIIGAGTEYNFKPLIDFLLERYGTPEPDSQNDGTDDALEPDSQNDGTDAPPEPTRQNGGKDGQNDEGEDKNAEKPSPSDKMTDTSTEPKNFKNIKKGITDLKKIFSELQTLAGGKASPTSTNNFSLIERVVKRQGTAVSFDGSCLYTDAENILLDLRILLDGMSLLQVKVELV